MCVRWRVGGRRGRRSNAHVLAQAGHVDYDGDTPIDHASDPWIMALLKDRVKYRGKGARQNVLNAYESAEGKTQQERTRIVLAAIRNEEEQYKKAVAVRAPAAGTAVMSARSRGWCTVTAVGRRARSRAGGASQHDHDGRYPEV
jgi:hypothetical protein